MSGKVSALFYFALVLFLPFPTQATPEFERYICHAVHAGGKILTFHSEMTPRSFPTRLDFSSPGDLPMQFRAPIITFSRKDRLEVLFSKEDFSIDGPPLLYYGVADPITGRGTDKLISSLPHYSYNQLSALGFAQWRRPHRYLSLDNTRALIPISTQSGWKYAITSLPSFKVKSVTPINAKSFVNPILSTNKKFIQFTQIKPGSLLQTHIFEFKNQGLQLAWSSLEARRLSDLSHQLMGNEVLSFEPKGKKVQARFQRLGSNKSVLMQFDIQQGKDFLFAAAQGLDKNNFYLVVPKPQISDGFWIYNLNARSRRLTLHSELPQAPEANRPGRFNVLKMYHVPESPRVVAVIGDDYQSQIYEINPEKARIRRLTQSECASLHGVREAVD